MKAGTIATVVLTVVGLCAVVFAFVKNSSPYVTVAQAREIDGTGVHLAGDLNKESLKFGRGFVQFEIKDKAGDRATVVYKGLAPSNINDATQVVAIGTMKGEVFEADKLLLKCPSKYESEAGPQS
jgi:cytochrome c-type biogenesis protein CcmE